MKISLLIVLSSLMFSSCVLRGIVNKKSKNLIDIGDSILDPTLEEEDDEALNPNLATLFSDPRLELAGWQPQGSNLDEFRDSNDGIEILAKQFDDQDSCITANPSLVRAFPTTDTSAIYTLGMTLDYFRYEYNPTVRAMFKGQEHIYFLKISLLNGVVSLFRGESNTSNPGQYTMVFESEVQASFEFESELLYTIELATNNDNATLSINNNYLLEIEGPEFTEYHSPGIELDFSISSNANTEIPEVLCSQIAYSQMTLNSLLIETY